MEEWMTKNPIGTSLVGAAALGVVWKFLWPLLTSFIQTQTTTSRTESGTLEQLSRVLNDAIRRAEEERLIRVEAERERDKFYAELVSLKAKLEVALADIESTKKENLNLQYQLDICKGVQRAKNPKPS